MRFLILAHPNDETAFHVAAHLLRRHGKADVRMVSPQELVLAPFWGHRVADPGGANELRLHDGTVIDNGSTGVVFNRLRYLETPHFTHAPAADREYASMELFALVLSWMHSLRCAVINAPRPHGLADYMRDSLHWQKLAGAVGFETVSLERNSREPEPRSSPDAAGRFEVVIAGDAVIGTGDRGLQRRCRDFAREANIDLMKLRFSPGDIFLSADPVPALTTAAEIKAAVDLLEARA